MLFRLPSSALDDIVGSVVNKHTIRPGLVIASIVARAVEQMVDQDATRIVMTGPSLRHGSEEGGDWVDRFTVRLHWEGVNLAVTER